MVTKKFKFLYKMIKVDRSASNSLNPSIFEGLATLCAPDAVCFSRHIPHASGRILAERFCVIGTLRSNFLLHKKVHYSHKQWTYINDWSIIYYCDILFKFHLTISIWHIFIAFNAFS